MFNLENYLFNFVMAIASLWIVKRFWGSFFEKKRGSALSVLMWVLFFAFQIAFLCYSGDHKIGMSFANPILILMIAVCGYNSRGKSKFFLVVAFWVFWALVEIFTFFLLNVIKIEKERLNIIGTVVSSLIMIILVYVVSEIWNKKEREFIPYNIYLYLLFIPVGSIYIATNEFHSPKNTFSSIMTISILLLFNVVIFELYIKMNEIFRYEKERIVYAQQIDIISGNTEEQKKIMEEFHEEKHNLINELIVLKNGIENDDREAVIKNLNKIIKNYNEADTVSQSGNSTIDAIINFKYAIAREYGIDFKLKIFIPHDMPIEQCDIGVVLGNAIDNAIEAVRECKTKEKVIDISMGVKKEAWIMVIKNPYEHEIRRNRGGELVSTKQEKNRHGYGLKSIRRIADCYQGEAIVEAMDGTFSLTVVLNFEGLL